MPKTTRTNPRYMVSQPHAPSKKPKRAGKRTVKGGKDRKESTRSQTSKKKTYECRRCTEVVGSDLVQCSECGFNEHSACTGLDNVKEAPKDFKCMSCQIHRDFSETRESFEKNEKAQIEKGRCSNLDPSKLTMKMGKKQMLKVDFTRRPTLVKAIVDKLKSQSP
eukprot:CAMPEP_0167813182 /NCGR_PEP_ID=MMETSP0112_2-20121227/1700_1 /TAXON_ID=91324 /ORGANISM="Lotharella globosa, Strain CCCM811" /LENGTH=163 /DNA_ID=CAMNT_0007712213 /DNA_START=98 /DNA_END=585 /DNA_ORIENTATION=-